MPARKMPEEGMPGLPKGKVATINDIARMSGVSKKTVSRIINNSPLVRQDTREKVEALMCETAIFTGNDEMAAGIYRVAVRTGIHIPRQLSVIGYDDSSLASRLWPPLTSVRRHTRDTGRTPPPPC